MKIHELQSDQLYTWSDTNAERTRGRIAKAPQRPPAPTAPAQSHSPRRPHRALQTMWQARMQMRRRSRSWPQVLSVGELPGLAAADGLCAAGGLRSDSGVPRQLPPSARDLREDLRDQPRVAAPPGGTLKDRPERSALCPPHTDPCQ